MWERNEFMISFSATGARVACARNIIDDQNYGPWSGWVGSWKVFKRSNLVCKKIVIEVTGWKFETFSPAEGAVLRTNPGNMYPDEDIDADTEVAMSKSHQNSTKKSWRCPL